jgi:hypothetical protein
MRSGKKTFDCVKMKHRGAEKVQQLISGMTRDEELAFWAKGTEELRRRQKELKASRRGASK